MDGRIIEVGQRVRCSLSYCGPGIVVAVHGEQSPESVQSMGGGAVVMGGRASFDVAWAGGALSHRIPEAIVRGVQWTIVDEVDPQAVAGALRACEDKKQADQAAEVVRAAELDRKRAEAVKRYRHLERADSSTKRPHVLAASNIRRELRKAWPGVRFRVRSRSYSGGNAVDIGWTDGPTTEPVKAITDKYQEGHFDGMVDCYEYNRDAVFPGLYGGAQYVQAQRAMTLAGVRRAWALAGGDAPDIAVATHGGREMFDRWASKDGDAIFRAWASTDLTDLTD